MVRGPQKSISTTETRDTVERREIVEIQRREISSRFLRLAEKPPRDRGRKFFRLSAQPAISAMNTHRRLSPRTRGGNAPGAYAPVYAPDVIV